MTVALPESFSPLDSLPIGRRATVRAVDAPQAPPEWARWLAEMGFIAGEPVILLARAQPGGDPLVVRIGRSTFALRRAEAACVRVELAAAGEQPRAADSLGAVRAAAASTSA